MLALRSPPQADEEVVVVSGFEPETSATRLTGLCNGGPEWI